MIINHGHFPLIRQEAYKSFSMSAEKFKGVLLCCLLELIIDEIVPFKLVWYQLNNRVVVVYAEFN